LQKMEFNFQLIMSTGQVKVYLFTEQNDLSYK